MAGAVPRHAFALLAATVLALGGCENQVFRSTGGEIIPAPAGTISVYQLAGRLRLDVIRNSPNSATLGNAANSVLLFADLGGRVFVNGRELPNSGGAQTVGKMIFVPRRLVGEIASRLKPEPRRPGPGRRRPVRSRPAPRPKLCRVVLDPGHGGKDPGAIGVSGIREKDVNLSTALAAAEVLRRHNVEVVLTRADDRFIALNDRAAAGSGAG